MGPNPSLAMVRMMYNTEIIGFLVVGCCDFIAQSILVRIADHVYQLHLYCHLDMSPPQKKKKDIPLLDCVGSQYSRRHSSYIPSIRILRFRSNSILSILYISPS